MPKEIFNHWVQITDNNHRDKEIMTFLTQDQEFPQSRGRRSLDIQKDGRIIIEEIGPDDRPVLTSGSFTFEAPDRINVFMDSNNNQKTMTLKIIVIENKKLTVKILR